MRRAWVLAAGLLLGCGSSSDGGGAPSTGGGGASAGGSANVGASAGNAATAGNASTSGGTGGGSTGGGAAGSATGNTGGTSSAGSAASGGSAGTSGGTANDPYAPTFDSQHGCRPKGPTLDQVTGARVLVNGTFNDELTAFTIIGGYLYYANRSKGIYRIALPANATPQPELVASATDAIYLLFGGGDSIYTVQGNSAALARYPLASLPTTGSVVLTGFPERMPGVDASNIYYSTGLSIFQLPFSAAVPGATPKVLLPSGGANLVVSDAFIYYLDSGSSAARMPVTGGAVEPLFSIGAPGELAIVSGTVYLTMTSHVLRWDPGGSFDFTTLASGSPIIAGGSNDWGVEQLKADADKVYYREANGTLAWAKTDGTACRIVVELPSGISDNNEWAMTDTHYYFITNEKQLHELPR